MSNSAVAKGTLILAENEIETKYLHSQHLIQDIVLLTIKESSPITKLRIIFDVSCKTSNDISLNDALNIDPTIQNDLFSIALMFQTLDIIKMYRKLERIVWWFNPSEQLQHIGSILCLSNSYSGYHQWILRKRHYFRSWNCSWGQWSQPGGKIPSWVFRFRPAQIHRS